MPLKIRLARGGAKKRPYYRIVVAEATAPRDGSDVHAIIGLADARMYEVKNNGRGRVQGG